MEGLKTNSEAGAPGSLHELERLLIELELAFREGKLASVLNCRLCPFIPKPFQGCDALETSLQTLVRTRDSSRNQMIALQEEMDWLIYAAYGLLSEDHSAARATLEPEPLEREQRPFEMWAKAEGC